MAVDSAAGQGPREGTAGAPDRDWDAFLSYSSRDAGPAGRVQRFLERYRLPGGRRLRVYRDETDIEGGALPDQIRTALARSGCLLVCCSDAAASSDWVAREIAAFREARTDGPVLPVLVADDPPANLPASLRDAELRWADLRSGWRLGRPKRRTRQELVRAVAAVSGIPFRELLPLDRKRRRRSLARGALLLGAAAVAAASVPVVEWRDVTPDGAGMIGGCGTLDDGVVLYHMNERRATTNIVNVLRGDSAVGPLERGGVTPRRRLLTGIAAAEAFPGCSGSLRGWVGEPEPGRCVALSRSDRMLSLADRFGGTEAPATDVEVGGARSTVDQVWPDPDLRAWDAYGRTVTPSAGLPVSAVGDELWLGFPGDDFTPGGLWRSTDGGEGWEVLPGLVDVRSVHHSRAGVLVAGRWEGELDFWLVSDTVEALGVPRRGDDLEVCGEEGGHPVVRTGRTVYRRVRTPWWRARLEAGGASP